MRISLASRISIAIAGVLVVAMLSSVVNLVLSARVNHLFQSLLVENLTALTAADSLKTAMLEQRGVASLYLLDRGNPRWRLRIEESLPVFDQAYELALSTASDEQQLRILEELRQAQATYQQQRLRSAALYDAGLHEEAADVLVNEVQPSFEQVRSQIGALMSINERLANQKAAMAEQQERLVQWMALGSTLLIVGFGLLLLWTFFHDLLYPIRRLAEEMGSYSNRAAEDGNELELIGQQLRALMSDAAQVRGSLQRSQNELLLAERLASVGKLAASVAHEIRNPLTSVKLLLFSIRKQLVGEPDGLRKLDVVSGEITHLERIVNSFLDFSRPPDVHPVRVSATALLEQTLELIYYRLRENRVELIREEATELPPIMADPNQLKQVFVNLLDNAIELMPDGGQIRVSARLEPGPDDADWVVLRFADTGPGMSEEVRSRIFEPFFTGRSGGTGLGLPIAASIVARHYGRLTVESTGHEGTVFAVSFPAIRDANHG